MLETKCNVETHEASHKRSHKNTLFYFALIVIVFISFGFKLYFILGYNYSGRKISAPFFLFFEPACRLTILLGTITYFSIHACSLIVAVSSAFTMPKTLISFQNLVHFLGSRNKCLTSTFKSKTSSQSTILVS